MVTSHPLSIVVAASEVVGFAKTGGLADVCGYLPLALAAKGHTCAVILPLYRCIRNRAALEPTDHWLAVPLAGQIIAARLWRSQLPGSTVPVYLIEHPDFFERDDPKHGRSLYTMTFPDGSKRDYPDNGARFVFFNRAVMEAIPYLGFTPDVLHANDWQTGLLPVYLRELYRLRPAYRNLSSLFTIHNIAYQGVFPRSEYHLTGLDHRLFNARQLEFYQQYSFMKAGIVFADWVNTVSPTYAKEIQTTYFGCGLEGVLTERRDRLSGIVNGVDYRSWDPATDTHLPMGYTIDTVETGKAACKKALQQRFGLPQEPRVPILGMIARLVEQKGIELLLKCADELMKQPIQIIILGEGDPDYQHQLRVLQERYPQHIGLFIGFDEGIAHQIEAGADLYLMPSLFEPSGLNQLYSLRYGTPPIVRATGGLSDTVANAVEPTSGEDIGTGFRFQAFTPQALLGAIQRACEWYHHHPDWFLQLVRNGMQQDWSWNRSATAYEAVYRRLVEERNARAGSVRGAELW